MGNIYRVYRWVDQADTSRDPSDIIVTEMGYTDDKDRAFSIANKYMDEFFPCEYGLNDNNDGTYSATNRGSYPHTVVVCEINLE